MNSFDILDTYKRRLEKTQATDIMSFDGQRFSYLEQAAILTHFLKLGKNNDFARPYDTYGNIIKNAWSRVLYGHGGEYEKNTLFDSPVTYGPSLFDEIDNVPFQPPQKSAFTFIDLFAGIGGFRIAMQNLGGECVFSSEWDEQADRKSVV